MSIDLSSNARKLIAESPSGPQLADFAAWLAPHQYTVFVIEQHLRHLAFLAPRLRGASAGTHSATQLRVVFGAQRNPHSRSIDSPVRDVFTSASCSRPTGSTPRRVGVSPTFFSSTTGMSSTSVAFLRHPAFNMR